MPLADSRMIFAKLKNNSTIAIRNRRLKTGFKKTVIFSRFFYLKGLFPSNYTF